MRETTPNTRLFFQKRKSAKLYSEALKSNENIITPKIIGEEDTHVFHQYTIRVTNGKRDELAKTFQENNLPFGIYYPIPLHLQKAYLDERYEESKFQVTNKLVKEVISLPMHTELDEEQIAYITCVINKVV